MAQYGDEGKEASCCFKIDIDFAMEAFDENICGLVMEGSPTHIDGLDAASWSGTDGLVIAIAEGGIIFEQATQWREREVDRTLEAMIHQMDGEDQAIADHCDDQSIGPGGSFDEAEIVFFDEFIDGDMAFFFGFGVKANGLALCDSEVIDAIGVRIVASRVGGHGSLPRRQSRARA